jgi:hypothetical protein
MKAKHCLKVLISKEKMPCNTHAYLVAVKSVLSRRYLFLGGIAMRNIKRVFQQQHVDWRFERLEKMYINRRSYEGPLQSNSLLSNSAGYGQCPVFCQPPVGG